MKLELSDEKTLITNTRTGNNVRKRKPGRDEDGRTKIASEADTVIVTLTILPVTMRTEDPGKPVCH